jgi:hypothetical protein
VFGDYRPEKYLSAGFRKIERSLYTPFSSSDINLTESKMHSTEVRAHSLDLYASSNNKEELVICS